jgi:prepilin-type N-terminal cleavage/methylation domain-containing protein
MRLRRRKRNGQSGFTLVEILVSLVLATIAMIGVIALYRAQTSASSFSRRTTEATILAEDKLERLRTATLAAQAATAEPLMDETGLANAAGPFTRTTTITAVTPGTEALWHLKVVVSWTEEGITKSVTVNGRRKQ